MMNEEGGEKMKIMVCADGSDFAATAVKFASGFSKNYGADLMVLYVIESEISREKPVSDDYGDEWHKAKQVIKNAEEIISRIAPDISPSSRIAVGPISAEIVRIAEEDNFDGIIVGTKGKRGLSRMLLGSVADDVIHYAHCPVVVAR